MVLSRILPEAQQVAAVSHRSSCLSLDPPDDRILSFGGLVGPTSRVHFPGVDLRLYCQYSYPNLWTVMDAVFAQLLGSFFNSCCGWHARYHIDELV